MDYLDIVIIVCDTNIISNTVIRSIFKNIKSITNFNIIVFDNSKISKFILDDDLKYKSNIKIIDNTQEQFISFKSIKSNYRILTRGFAAIEHSLTIQWFIDNYDKFLLLDCDVILKQDLDFINEIDDTIITCSDLMFVSTKIGHTHAPRCVPFIQYFNAKLMRKLKIPYFDGIKIAGSKNFKYALYDTGACLYHELNEQNKLNQLKIIDYSKYVYHCKGAALDKASFYFNLNDLMQIYDKTYIILIPAINYNINYAIWHIELVKKQNILGNKNIYLYCKKDDYLNLPEIQKQYLKISNIKIIHTEENFKILNSLKLTYTWDLNIDPKTSIFLHQKLSARELTMLNKNEICIYTCITGKYDTLHEIKSINKEIDHICFTDDMNLKMPDGWKLQLIPEEFNEFSNVKKQRLIKILPHKILDRKYKLSIWIDASHEFNIDIYNDFISKLNFEDFNCYRKLHPQRKCIFDEINQVVKVKKDTKENTNPIIKKLQEEKFPIQYGLTETGILIRKHFDLNVIKFMTLWADMIKKYSHRDQLSFDYIRWKIKDLSWGVLNDVFPNISKTKNPIFNINIHKKYH